MNLSDEQKAAVAKWVESGAELSDIQQRLKDEFDLSLTYLDTRFLLGDLGLELLSEREEDEPAQPEDDDTAAEVEQVPPAADEVLPPEGTEDTPPADGDELPSPGGNVSVTVDQIAQPHTLVSGNVTFGDGKTAAWYLDQMGRLGLDPTEPDYRPSQEDIAAFQMELQSVLQQQGF